MNLENETDLATLKQAVRLLEQENRKLLRLNLELRQALAEAKGERAQQLELQIAALEQTLASRNRALFGDSLERRTRDEEPKPEQPHPVLPLDLLGIHGDRFRFYAAHLAQGGHLYLGKSGHY